MEKEVQQMTELKECIEDFRQFKAGIKTDGCNSMVYARQNKNDSYC